MKTTDIVSGIDAEILRLERVRALLTGSDTTVKRKPGASSSKSSKATSFDPADFGGKPKKRRLSAEARAKIAAAQRARWAKSRRATKKKARNAAAASAAASAAKTSPVSIPAQETAPPAKNAIAAKKVSQPKTKASATPAS
jgi:hypothetical protein